MHENNSMFRPNKMEAFTPLMFSHSPSKIMVGRLYTFLCEDDFWKGELSNFGWVGSIFPKSTKIHAGRMSSAGGSGAFKSRSKAFFASVELESPKSESWSIWKGGNLWWFENAKYSTFREKYGKYTKSHLLVGETKSTLIHLKWNGLNWSWFKMC